MDAHLNDARILIVDDELVNTVLLERLLHAAGYADVTRTTEPEEAVALFAAARAQGRGFDLLCTDLHMPRMTGLQVIDAVVAGLPDDDFFPILVLTADATPEAEQDALQRGAKDFLTKPFRKDQIRLRVANLLRTRYLQAKLRDHVDRLEEMVYARTIELEAARLDVLDRLAAAAEYRDYATGRHTQRVGLLAALLARQLGLPRAEVELIRRAAPLHDVGKIGVPDHILLKPGKLTDEEYDLMRDHVDVGVRLLANGRSQLIALAQQIAETHHERWDGSGYPHGLRGEAIPQVGLLVAVADVFDTLAHERPYKRAWPVDEAIAEIVRQRGRWFAPHVVDAFLAVVDARPRLLADLERVGDPTAEG
ncbi:MAG: response regulator, partial [Trueperaceae bacterium]|nr:response regulator [Trueperaceae bacterium]